MEATLTAPFATDAHLVALGAHSDDLAFSLGAAFRDGRLAGCTVITVFSRSGYTLADPAGDVERISALRAAEDAGFFSRVSAGALVWLGQQDAPLRRGLRGVSVFSAAVRGEDVRAAGRALDAVLPATGILLAPLALGSHVDHRLLCAVACELYRRGDYAVVFYEDLPYAAFMALPAIERVVESVARRLETTLCAQEWTSPALAAAKQWAVDSYPSQCDAGTLPALLHHARRLAQDGMDAERVWIPCGGLSGALRVRSE